MKVTPVSMVPELVLSTFRGQKTHTRRICTPQPEPAPGKDSTPFKEWTKQMEEKLSKKLEVIHTSGRGAGLVFPNCKYGGAGDLLWVREKVRLIGTASGEDAGIIRGDRYEFRYELDGTTVELDHYPERLEPLKIGRCVSNGCFRELARIWLQNETVSAERVHDTSWEDIQAEGLTTEFSGIDGIQDLEEKWKKLWISMYGLGTWLKNPWVHVIKYKMVSSSGMPEALKEKVEAGDA